MKLEATEEITVDLIKNNVQQFELQAK